MDRWNGELKCQSKSWHLSEERKNNFYSDFIICTPHKQACSLESLLSFLKLLSIYKLLSKKPFSNRAFWILFREAACVSLRIAFLKWSPWLAILRWEKSSTAHIKKIRQNKEATEWPVVVFVRWLYRKELSGRWGLRIACGSSIWISVFF